MLYSSCKSLNDFVKKLVRGRSWTVYGQKRRHLLLRHSSGAIISVPFSPSDRRAFLNFKADIARVERKSHEPEATI